MIPDPLAADIARFSASVDFWKVVRIWLTAFTVLFTVATIWAQLMELRRSRDLATCQRELLNQKDEQLRRELSEKDVRIAESNRASSEAAERAATALKSAAEANEQAARAEVRAAQLEKEAELLRRTNLEMQASLTPRSLLVSDFAMARLARFKGTLWDLHVPAGDPEASDLGNLVGGVLQKCGWTLGNGSTDLGVRFPDGVTILARRSGVHWAAGSELVSYLLANRADAALLDDKDARDDRLVVRVGYKVKPALLTPVLTEAERAPLAGC